jgi:hypothetical protein
MRWMMTVVAFVVLAGCGGGGDAGLPAVPDEDVVRLKPGDRPVRFRLDTEVSETIRQSIVETLAWAHTDLGDSGPITMHVYSDEEHFVRAYTAEYAISADAARLELAGGQTAFVSPGGHMWIYLPNYLDAPEGFRRAALFHEYVHTVQDWEAEVRFQSEAPAERSFIPRWLVEGCAEYISMQAGAKRGFVDAEEERAYVADEVRGSGTTLESLESGGEASFLGGSGEAYTVGWLGCERLAARSGMDKVLHGFWLAMAKVRDWRQAFSDTFGLTPAAFYDSFRVFRAGL